MATGLEEGEISLTVNGSVRAIAPNATLADLLAELDLDPRMIVVEHNREILRDREQFGSIFLRSGDTLELVHFVGGG